MRSLTLVPLILAAALVADASAEPVYESLRVPADSAPSLLQADDDVWSPARTIAWGPKEYETTFRALWNESGLFVRFDATDPDPWHTLTQRDARLWEEEVVELFLARVRNAREYTELQINPANVVCDLRVNLAERMFDARWNLAGLETRVQKRREGWTAVAFLPWTGLQSVPPKPGDQWSFNVFRIERPGGISNPDRDALLLAWSPTGERSFHVPEAFGDLLFR